ncbi:hypothetical protein VTK73DRAFT_2181 [Phialemonium thermophilum]|uniref:2EXR domain-containing protein n=1 Tax=Phialemonium thermophilum TaxID=223376 RepID=A0ABR3VSG8_9PEZI
MSADTGEAVPSQPAQFHGFPRLPTELRWMIWQMAICTDETPRIHYYALFNDDDRDKRRSLLPDMIRRCKAKPRWPPNIIKKGKKSIGEPLPELVSRPDHCAWTADNRFLYFWDAGLLTACRESRRILLCHRKKSPRRPRPKRWDVVRTRSQGHAAYAEVTKRDIVCFRFAPEHMDVCVSLRWDVLIRRLPFFHLPYVSDINLAMDFDDSWANMDVGRTKAEDLMREPSPRGLAARAYWAWLRGEIPRWTRLWLIDRGGRLPANYKLPAINDYRYVIDFVYNRSRYPCKPERNRFFTDGARNYVESYSWEPNANTRPRDYYWDDQPDVPLLSFMWRVASMFERSWPPKKGPANTYRNTPMSSNSAWESSNRRPNKAYLVMNICTSSD